MTHFDQLGVSEALVTLLKKQGIMEPTPVQEQAIPPMRAGRDVIAQAQTGTGKTLAFLLPILAKIKPQGAVAQALVVAPTRELAVQIAHVAEPLGTALGIGTIAIYGGADMERQKEKLRRHPQLIIGTPGRLLDHVRRGTLALGSVNKIVLDEAAQEFILRFRCGRKTDLDFFEPHSYEEIEKRQLLIEAHWNDERLIAVAQID